MKTRNLFFAFVVLLVSATVFATETPKTEMLSAQDGKILVNYQSQVACKFEVTISDPEGAVLHQWQTENPQNILKRSFDLHKLDNGTYLFELNYGCKSLNAEVNIKNGKVQIGDLTEVNEPCFMFKNDKLFITLLNPSMKGVYLNVYKDGEQYNGFQLGKGFDVQKCIDFSTANKGTYEIVLTDHFRSHNFTVNK
jgi:hypothetical protein